MHQNDYTYACPTSNYKMIYMLDMNLPCCGKKISAPKIDMNIIYDLIKDNFSMDTRTENTSFLTVVKTFLPLKLRRKTDGELREYIAKKYF